MNKRLIVNLWVHDERYSKHDVIINPDHFSVALGDLFEICQSEASSNSSQISKDAVILAKL